jgi:pimeloyl-ACP methyl ester carboxylesterase
LLLYLNSQHPNEGWLNYLNGNAPKWSSLVVAGHSQGGGEAALIAKKHQVARVVMFAAPVDYSNTLMTFAPWLSAPHATSTENYYGFVHVNDLYAEAVITVWGLLGMNIYGERVLVDGELPPYNQSHQLMTATTPTATGQNSYHSSVAVDNSSLSWLEWYSVKTSEWKSKCDRFSTSQSEHLAGSGFLPRFLVPKLDLQSELTNN